MGDTLPAATEDCISSAIRFITGFGNEVGPGLKLCNGSVSIFFCNDPRSGEGSGGERLEENNRRRVFNTELERRMEERRNEDKRTRSRCMVVVVGCMWVRLKGGKANEGW